MFPHHSRLYSGGTLSYTIGDHDSMADSGNCFFMTLAEGVHFFGTILLSGQPVCTAGIGQSRRKAYRAGIVNARKGLERQVNQWHTSTYGATLQTVRGSSVR